MERPTQAFPTSLPISKFLLNSSHFPSELLTVSQQRFQPNPSRPSVNLLPPSAARLPASFPLFGGPNSPMECRMPMEASRSVLSKDWARWNSKPAAAAILKAKLAHSRRPESQGLISTGNCLSHFLSFDFAASSCNDITL